MSQKSAEQVVRELKERQASEKAAKDAKIKVMADAIREREANEKREQEQRLEEARREREQEFEQELEAAARAAFFAGNPGASEALYQSVRDDFRKKVIQDRAENASRYQHSMYRYR